MGPVLLGQFLDKNKSRDAGSRLAETWFDQVAF